MIRVLAIFLIVWGQLIAGCFQGNFVECVHEDGTTALELAFAPCCEDDLGCSVPAIDDHGYSHDGDERDTLGDVERDCCQDSLLHEPQLTIAPSDATPDRAHHELAKATLTVLPTTLTALSPTVRTPLVRDRGPPGPDIVRRCLRSVRLRC